MNEISQGNFTFSFTVEKVVKEETLRMKTEPLTDDPELQEFKSLRVSWLTLFEQ